MTRCSAIGRTFMFDHWNTIVAWIGLYKTTTCRTLKGRLGWEWADSSTDYIYQNWLMNQPDGSTGCGLMRPNGKWGDWACNYSLPFVCEKSAGKPTISHGINCFSNVSFSCTMFFTLMKEGYKEYLKLVSRLYWLWSTYILSDVISEFVTTFSETTTLIPSSTERPLDSTTILSTFTSFPLQATTSAEDHTTVTSSTASSEQQLGQSMATNADKSEPLPTDVVAFKDQSKFTLKDFLL